MDRLSCLRTFYSIVVAVLLPFGRNDALNRNIENVHDFNVAGFLENFKSNSLASNL